MADLTGIDNIGEFFSQHYLTELLEGDLKQLRKAWRDSAGQSPPARLRSVSRPMSNALAEAARYARPERVFEAVHGMQVQLCEALGYTYQPGVFALSDGYGVATLCQVDRQSEAYLLVIEGRVSQESGDAALDLVS